MALSKCLLNTLTGLGHQLRILLFWLGRTLFQACEWCTVMLFRDKNRKKKRLHWEAMQIATLGHLMEPKPANIFWLFPHLAFQGSKNISTGIQKVDGGGKEAQHCLAFVEHQEPELRTRAWLAMWCAYVADLLPRLLPTKRSRDQLFAHTTSYSFLK